MSSVVQFETQTLRELKNGLEEVESHFWHLDIPPLHYKQLEIIFNIKHV